MPAALDPADRLEKEARLKTFTEVQASADAA
jgi:hypothetical protein